MASIIKIELNLVPGAAPGGIMPRVRVSQGDAQDRILQFELYDGAEVADLTDVVSIFFGGQKPDGNGFTVTCSATDNLITGILTPQSTVLAGLIPCKLYLTTNTGSVRSATFDMQVDPDPLNDAGTSDTDITAIVAAAGAYAAQAQASAEEAATVAEETAQAVVDNKLDKIGGDSAQDIITFTSSDNDTETGIINNSSGETAMTALTSGDTHSGLLGLLSKTVLNTRKLINTVKSAWNVVSSQWVSGETVGAGGYRLYNGVFYRCILAHTTSDSITPTNTTYWTPVSVAGELYSLNSNVANSFVLKDTPTLTAVNNGFTATKNCFALLSVRNNTSGGTYVYVASQKFPAVTNRPYYVCYIVEIVGGQGEIWFPVIKGDKITVSNQSSLGYQFYLLE